MVEKQFDSRCYFKKEQLANKHLGPLLTIYQVNSLQLTSIEDSFFSPPSDFEYVIDVNEARGKDRLLLEIAAKEEFENKPLSKNEQQMYFGDWILEKEKNQIMINIQSNQNGIKFKITNLSKSNPKLSSRDEFEAKLLDRMLLVETPPNFKLYKLNLTKDKLISLENPFMEFIKIKYRDRDNK